MAGMITSSRKHKMIQNAEATFELCQNARPRRFNDFKLNWPARLLLDDDGA